MNTNENMNKECELTDEELAAVAGGKGDEAPTYNGYPVRNSSWHICEIVIVRNNRCGNCNYFRYQNQGDNVGGCDGYCTKE